MGIFSDIAHGVGAIAGNIPALAADALTGGAYSQQQANQQNVDLARESRDWSQSMSSTAYQRAVDDMRRAGLNPMLAYSQGGASTPSPTTATVTAPKLGAGLASSAKSMIELSSSQKNVAADTNLKAASAGTQATQADLNNVLAMKATANAKESEANASRARADEVRIKADTLGVHSRSEQERMKMELNEQRFKSDKSMQQYDSVLERIKDTLGAAGSAVKVFKPLPDINIGRGKETIVDKYGEVIKERPAPTKRGSYR